MEQIEKQYTPELAKKVDKRYKWRFIMYRRIAAGAILLLLIAIYGLCMVLKGNYYLQKQLADKKISVIMPNGALTSKSK